jgi:fatty-acyl-CoA synthase
VVLASVYAVPDPVVGDQVMAALQLRPEAAFDPAAFATFLDEQPDLGTKWAPRFVRIAAELPVTQTNKILKRELRRERWECADPVWWRPAKDDAYRRLEPTDVAALRDEFARRERLAALDTV